MATADVSRAPPPTPSLLRRLAAMAYESLIVAAILIVAGFAFVGAATSRLEGSARHLFQGYLVVVLGLYFVWCWRRGGQTLPMKAWKLRLVHRDGGPLGTPRAMLRYALAVMMLGPSAVAAIVLWREPGAGFAWLLLAPGALTLLWSLVDAEGQFLHDRLAGTKIIGVPPTTS